MLLTDELGISKERQKKIFHMADQMLSTSIDVIKDVTKRTRDEKIAEAMAEAEKGLKAQIRADLDQLENEGERIVYGYFVGALALRYSGHESSNMIVIIGGSGGK
jgi:hypothetical protein